MSPVFVCPCLGMHICMSPAATLCECVCVHAHLCVHMCVSLSVAWGLVGVGCCAHVSLCFLRDWGFLCGCWHGVPLPCPVLGGPLPGAPAGQPVPPERQPQPAAPPPAAQRQPRRVLAPWAQGHHCGALPGCVHRGAVGELSRHVRHPQVSWVSPSPKFPAGESWAAARGMEKSLLWVGLAGELRPSPFSSWSPCHWAGSVLRPWVLSSSGWRCLAWGGGSLHAGGGATLPQMACHSDS